MCSCSATDTDLKCFSGLRSYEPDSFIIRLELLEIKVVIHFEKTTQKQCIRENDSDLYLQALYAKQNCIKYMKEFKIIIVAKSHKLGCQLKKQNQFLPCSCKGSSKIEADERTRFFYAADSFKH